jgi:hypothetical protein
VHAKKAETDFATDSISKRGCKYSSMSTVQPPLKKASPLSR